MLINDSTGERAIGKILATPKDRRCPHRGGIVPNGNGRVLWLCWWSRLVPYHTLDRRKIRRDIEGRRRL